MSKSIVLYHVYRETGIKNQGGHMGVKEEQIRELLEQLTDEEKRFIYALIIERLSDPKYRTCQPHQAD